MKSLRAGWAPRGPARPRPRRCALHHPPHARDLDVEQDVPEGELIAWFGHGKESTTRHWYVKRRVYRPDYLAAAAAAVEDC